MKIACVTPFGEGNSVGNVAERVALEMRSAGHEVLIIGTGRPPYWQTELDFVAAGEYGRVWPQGLSEFDAVVYNLANHPASSPIFWLMEQVPGIAVLHDRVYADGYNAYTQLFLGKPAEFVATARKYYGEAGVAFAWRFLAQRAASEELYRFSFLEPLLEHATGVVVHYELYGSQVRSLCSVPVVSSYRPSYPIVKIDSSSIRDGADFVLSYVGCITRHRCLDLLFAVLADRKDLLARARVAIVGLTEDQQYAEFLQQRAGELGIAEAIHWAFNATDDIKHEILSNSDAAFNCRTLNSEGLSGSLLEQMTHGLPVIVNASGFALEAPENAVCFVEQADMRLGIERALEILVLHPERRRAIGQRAQTWAKANTSMTAYVDAIVRLAEDVSRKSVVAGVRARVGGILKDMNLKDESIKAALDRTIIHLLEGDPAL